MSRHGTTIFIDCTDVGNKSLHKSVFTHGPSLSDVAYSKHFYALRISELLRTINLRDRAPTVGGWLVDRDNTWPSVNFN